MTVKIIKLVSYLFILHYNYNHNHFYRYYCCILDISKQTGPPRVGGQLPRGPRVLWGPTAKFEGALSKKPVCHGQWRHKMS